MSALYSYLLVGLTMLSTTIGLIAYDRWVSRLSDTSQQNLNTGKAARGS